MHYDISKYSLIMAFSKYRNHMKAVCLFECVMHIFTNSIFPWIKPTPIILILYGSVHSRSKNLFQFISSFA